MSLLEVKAKTGDSKKVQKRRNKGKGGEGGRARQSPSVFVQGNSMFWNVAKDALLADWAPYLFDVAFQVFA